MTRSKRIVALPVGRSITLGKSDPRFRRDTSSRFTDDDLEPPLYLTDEGKIGIRPTQPISNAATVADLIAILKEGGILGR